MMLLADEVAAAKGALLLRPDIEDTLREFQEAVHRRTVGSYETLLTSLVDEVIGDGSKVRLELSSERGSPCLDLFVEKDGHRLSLMEGQGGALNNVVSMGLRLIATLRAGGRPVLVLDEVDCWVQSWRVAAFYRVMARISSRMGLQVLVVTHHPPSLLNEVDPRVFMVEGDPMSEEGVSVRMDRSGPAWREATQPGLRRIRLRDFAGYRDCVFDLGPGINVISGDNNVGKSRVPRALRAACYGDGIAEDIRVGMGAAAVTIEVEGGEAIEWSRENKRNPVTLWRRLSCDGTVVASHGGRSPPEWVDAVCGIARRNGLDVQVGHQLSPVFLLGETAAQRASVLSIGRESSLLQDMMKLQRSDVEAANATVRRGEREISVLDERLRGMSGLREAEASVDEARLALLAIEARMPICARLASTIPAIEAARRRIPVLQAKVDATSPQAVGEPPQPRDTKAMMRAAHGMRRIRSTMAKSQGILRALEGGLPSIVVPAGQPRPHAAVSRHAGLLRGARQAHEVSRKRVEALDGVAEPVWATAQAAAARTRLQRLVELDKAKRQAAIALSLANQQLAEAEANWDETISGRPCPCCGVPLPKGGVPHGG